MKPTKEQSDWLRELGRKGGSRRVANQTPAERSASARHAARVRWAAKKKDDRKGKA